MLWRSSSLVITLHYKHGLPRILWRPSLGPICNVEHQWSRLYKVLSQHSFSLDSRRISLARYTLRDFHMEAEQMSENPVDTPERGETPPDVGTGWLLRCRNGDTWRDFRRRIRRTGYYYVGLLLLNSSSSFVSQVSKYYPCEITLTLLFLVQKRLYHIRASAHLLVHRHDLQGCVL